MYEAAKTMKNGKSSGTDDIHAEHIKYAPPSIHENIAHNTTAKDGNPPDEHKIGILTPLPKPGQKKGPPEKLVQLYFYHYWENYLQFASWDEPGTG